MAAARLIVAVPPEGSNSWRRNAVCQDADPRLFDPATDDEQYRYWPARAQLAAQLCSTCPVRAQCQLDADTNEMEGVWAGWWRVKRHGRISRRRIALPRQNRLGA